MKKPDIFNELVKAFPYLHLSWNVQNDGQDYKSNFIYNCFSFDLIMEKIQDLNLDKGYVIHRWYNFHSSKACEDVFIKLGAKRELNEKHKKIDFFFKNVNYDLKLTVYPRGFKDGVNLNTRSGKDKLINWLYKNQSQQGRKHLDNRLFIVCKGKSGKYIDSLKIKADYNLLKHKISQFIKHYENRSLYSLDIEVDNLTKKVYSDIIFIEG